ncbi:MAG: DUF642 domain-containing protein [Bacteroidota bacterium]
MANKRYPGARPFKDTLLDRMLFFGRTEEKKKLLHLILSHNMVVLFAKSGVGKSSLLNAGVFDQLAQREYFPVSVRVNDPDADLLETIDLQIAEMAAERNVDYLPGSRDSLWDFLKTLELWNEEDKLLTPVLVFDQFEELFTLGHTEKQRKKFFRQLAELSEAKRKLDDDSTEDEKRYHKENPPKVKIVMSLREEFLAQLEEISIDIPSVLRNRFRLTAMSKEQAIEAIERPAEINDQQFQSKKFSYSKNAIEAVTNFLMKKDAKERLKMASSDSKLPWKTMILFAIGITFFPLLTNFLYTELEGSSFGELIFFAVFLLIIPVFLYTLVIRRSVASRHTVIPVTLLYAWNCLCWFFLSKHTENYLVAKELLIPFSIVITVLVLLVLWFLRAVYRIGRQRLISTMGTPYSKNVSTMEQGWSFKTLRYLYGTLLLSLLLVLMIDYLAIFFISLLFTFVYLAILAIVRPVAPKHIILPIIISSVLMCFGFIIGDSIDDYPVDDLSVLFFFYLFYSFFIFLIISIPLMSYARGLKSIDPKLLERLDKSKGKIEPFQLQLLCQNVESKVVLKQGRASNEKEIVITENDFGGDRGMQRILSQFYDDQLKRVGWKNRSRVRRLCERGLISSSGRRLSLDEDDIRDRFKISRETLSDLIDFRLLRAEPRLGNKYYEISHDTLLQPILTSAKKHITRGLFMKWLVAGIIVVVFFWLYSSYISLVEPASYELCDEMNQTLAEPIPVDEKLVKLEENLARLERREQYKWLIVADDSGFNDTGYDPRFSDTEEYSLQGCLKRYKRSLEQLDSLNRSLIKIDTIQLVDDRGKDVLNYDEVPPGSISLRFVLDDTHKAKLHRGHLLQVEWLKSSYNYSNEFDKLVVKPLRLSLEKDTLLESITLPYNNPKSYQVRIYELDSNDLTKKYLVDKIDLRVVLNERDEYRKLLEKKPNDSRLNAYAGFTHFLNHSFNEPNENQVAIDQLNKAIELDSTFALAYVWRAIARRSSMDYSVPLSDLLTASRLDPDLNEYITTHMEDVKGNLIENGSFENPVLAFESQMIYSELADNSQWGTWTSDNQSFMLLSGPIDLRNTFTGNRFSQMAFNGNQYIQLSGFQSSNIEQQIDTNPGNEYLISFSYAPSTSKNPVFEDFNVRWNGEIVYSVKDQESPGGDWITRFVRVTANSKQSSLQFDCQGLDINGAFFSGPFLDQVMVIPTQVEWINHE